MYFRFKTSEPVLAVPETALMRGADGDWTVYVEEAEGEYEPVEVELGRSIGGLREVSGLAAGQRVVLRGAFFWPLRLPKAALIRTTTDSGVIMFNRVVDLAVQNRLLVLIALAVLIATAAFQIPKLNLDAFPDVTNVQVAVNTEAPGLAAEEVEQLITYPIEAVMYALPDVEEVRSISKTGLSGVTVVFKEGTDIYFARQLVFERLQAARELIPDGVGVPEMGPNTSGLGQVYQYLLIADPDSGYDAMELRSLNDWLVKLLLIPAEGVTEILSFGGEVRQYQVNSNPARMLSYDLSQNDVMEALENNNSNVGGWYMGRGQEQLVIRGMGWLGNGEQGLEQIRQVPVKTSDGITVTVNDVAEVALGTEIRQGAVTMAPEG